MRKQKSSLKESRGGMHRYITPFVILVIVLLISTPVAFGSTVYIFGIESVEEDDFLITITGGIGFSAVIYNNGTMNSTNVAVMLHVAGGFLERINQTITDTVNIPARGVAIISTGMLLGLGRVTITASANTTEKTAQGLQIITFSKVKDDTWKMIAESN